MPLGQLLEKRSPHFFVVTSRLFSSDSLGYLRQLVIVLQKGFFLSITSTSCLLLGT